MLLNLLNLYSLIFALFSKIEGMSKELDSLKPTLSLNATIIPNGTLNLSESYTIGLPESCFEQEVLCGPCDIIQLNLPTRPADGIILKSASSPFSKKITPPKILLRRPREQLSIISKNLQERNFETDESTTLSSTLLIRKELERLRNITNQQPVNITNINDVEFDSDGDDDDYTFYDTESTTNTKTDTTFDYTIFDYLTTVSDYSSTDFMTTADTIGTETSTDTESTDTSYTTGDSSTDTETTTDIETTFTDTEYQMTYLNEFESTTDFLDTTSEVIINSSAKDTLLTDTTTNSIDTTTNIGVTETSLKYNTDYDVIETSSLYRGSQYITNANVNARNYDTATELPTESIITTTMKAKIIGNNDPCPDFTFNCTVNCNGKNVKQVFFMSNCTIVKRVCYANVCPSNMNAVDSKNGTNVTTIDLVFVDDNDRKMYNLSVPTKKKLLKLCWETMFGQELVKLTMMDLVRYSIPVLQIKDSRLLCLKLIQI